jgi:hypothetical protein
MAYEVPRSKKRCASVMPFKFRNKVITDKNKTKSIIFNTPKTIENFYNNKEITKNKLMIYNTILKDINKYNWQNKLSKTTKLSIKDIDIIKEKHNDELIYKVYNYLEQKKDKISNLNKPNEPKMDKLKRLLLESKSEQDILAKTFSTQFVGNEEYKNLSYAFEIGHGHKLGDNLQYKLNQYNSTFRRTQSQLFKTNQGMTKSEKNLLNSIKSAKKRNIGIYSKVNYYNNQYDSFNSLQINRNLYNQLILQQEKEQIKQFLKKELQNEQRKFTYKLMPKIKTIELSKYKKETKESTVTSNSRKAIVNSIIDFSKIPRADIFASFRSVYLKTISKFLSTPTCRQGATMIPHLDSDMNINKLYLFGGMNIIRLNDLWVCSITSINKFEKKYIWKKVNIKGEKPLPRNGHSMVYYRNNLIMFGGIIEEKGGLRVQEDLLCYDLIDQKFSVEVCMNKFGVTWRSFHIAEILGQYMFIYGGGDDKGNIIADPWALDLERMKWEQAKFNTESLPKRKYHCSCQVFPPQKKYHTKFSLFKVYSEPGLFNSTKILVEGIYIFGGIDENLKCSNDILIIKRGRPLQLYKAIIKGKPPIARCESTMNFYEKLNVVIIYGGKNEYSKYGPYFNDMYFLDVETLTWIKIELNLNESFYPRGRHCSCVVGDEIIIFGGNNDNFLLKTDLLIGNLDIGESTKIIRANQIMKNKAKNKKDKNDSENNFEQEYNSNNESDKPDIYSNNEEDENENIIIDSKRRISLDSSNKEKMFDISPMNKFKKEAKILLNQKVQTSKNFFLDFPKQKKELQDKFKEIDAINFSSSDNQKIQDIIKNTFKEYNLN